MFVSRFNFLHVSCLLGLGVANAYQPNTSRNVYYKQQPVAIAEHFGKTVATFALTGALLFGDANPAFAAFAPSTIAAPSTETSTTAAQISLNKLPPSSISVEIQDLPVIGKLISGTYTKVKDGSIESPSVTIKSPKDKVEAVKEITFGGHLEFDVSGLLNTHLDVDIAAEKAGVAKIRVASNLIPPLPFKNLASSSASSPTGGKESPWNMVTNMGSGETYYYNEKTGLTQYDRPSKF